MNFIPQRGSPHRTLYLDLMLIGDPDPKTTLPTHSLDPELRAVVNMTVHEFQSSRAICVVCLPSRTYARPHDPDPVNPVSVPVWRALLRMDLIMLMSLHTLFVAGLKARFFQFARI